MLPAPALPNATLTPELESAMAAVETHLASLSEALHLRDGAAVELHASELHRGLQRAVEQFASAARSGPVPTPLRQRLMTASGQVAAQRESLARATAALDRAIDVLLPRDTQPAVYSAYGSAGRGSRGVIQA